MGATYSIFEQSFPPRPTWSVNDIPDLTGKVILVTGAYSDINTCNLNMSLFVGGNAGVGKETVKVRYETPFYPVLGLISLQQLLTHNAKVYLAARSAQKANAAITELENETGDRKSVV